MGLTVSFVLAPETGLCCLRHQRECLTSLISASGHQAHTTSPSVCSAFVSCAANVHRIPHPTSVTIAIRPSYEDGTGLILPVICGSDQRLSAAANWHDGQIRR
jgi:hypothetical protein